MPASEQAAFRGLTKEDGRRRPPAAHDTAQLFTLQFPIQRILLLPIVRHHHVHFDAVDVESRVNRGRKLPVRRGQEMVRRAQDRVLGDQDAACCSRLRVSPRAPPSRDRVRIRPTPGVLVRSRSEVGVGHVERVRHPLRAASAGAGLDELSGLLAPHAKRKRGTELTARGCLPRYDGCPSRAVLRR